MLERRTYDRLARVSALKPSRDHTAVPETRERAGTDDLSFRLGAHIGRNRYGEHLVARQWYSSPETCNVNGEALTLLRPTAARAAPFCVESAGNPAKWLFLDTETTGIAGGTGTYAFLVGLGWWDSGGLQVEQFFMRDHDEEHSVLLEVAHRLSERPVLVTFNGKSFDWPLLETRYRMTRSIDVPSVAAHLDFLHPARQLWKLRFKSLRLAELERLVLNAESLGWSRRDDIDSSRIPEIYFDYLRGGNPEFVAGVFSHNRMDLRGLAALAGRIMRTLADIEAIPSGDEGEALELYGVSRLLDRRGQRLRARAAYERALSTGLPVTVDRKARHELALLAKRENDFDRATELWRGLSRGAGPSPQACEQLAIYYERREGNVDEAARVVRAGIADLRRAAKLGTIESSHYLRLVKRFESRLVRLEGKRRRTS